jgi:hypothetical protein
MEISIESGDGTLLEAEALHASSRLFADAYGFGSVGERSKQSASSGGTQSNIEQSVADTSDKVPTEEGYYDPYVSIFRNVTPEVHTMADGETIESVARRNLGPGASETELRDYVQEIRDLNSGSDFTTGNTVVMPGHTADGDIIMPNKDGTTYTISGDPAQRYAEHQRLLASLPSKPPVGGGDTAPPSAESSGQNRACYPSYIDVEVFSRDGRTINRMRQAYLNCPGRPRQPIPADQVPWTNVFPWLRR